MPNEAIPEALGLVQELAAMERPTWDSIREGIPTWHPRNDGGDEGGDGGEGGTDDGGDKPITMTQAKLDRLIAGRVKQAEAKFADYGDLKAAAARLAEVERENMTASERLQAERDAAVSASDKASADLAAALLANTRMRVAMEANLPVDLMDRLKGDSEDALREDAEKLLAIVNPQGGGEGKPGDRQGEFDAGHRRAPDDGMTHEEALRLAREEPAKFNQLMDEGKIPASALRPSR